MPRNLLGQIERGDEGGPEKLFSTPGDRRQERSCRGSPVGWSQAEKHFGPFF